MRPESERPTIGRSPLGTRNWAAAGSDRGGGSGDRERLQILGSPDHGVLDSNGSHPLREKKEKRDSGPPTSLLTLPTLLTLGRVVAVPLIVCSTFSEIPLSYYMNSKNKVLHTRERVSYFVLSVAVICYPVMLDIVHHLLLF